MSRGDPLRRMTREQFLRGKTYLLIVIERQLGGPFAVTEEAEKDKTIRLKPGRYVRFDADSRLAKIDEEFELMRRFASYRFGSTSSLGGTLDDLDVDLLREFISRTESRDRGLDLSKAQMAESLRITEKGATGKPRVLNYALLMFSNHPEEFYPGAYCELITSALGSERRMEAKEFKGPIWKQYHAIVQYVKDYLLRTITIRDEGEAENRKVSNFPFAAFEELLANATVHKNYENRETIQIYILEDGVDIVNYNKPIPPLTVDDLNTRTVFYERRFENPEIRDMFKGLGIIESFGSGIGAAKKACQRNGSAPIVFKRFPDDVSITSVHIPASEEFLRITGARAGGRQSPDDQAKAFKEAETKILSSGYSKNVIAAMIKILHAFPQAVFATSDIAELLSCSAPSANAYRARLSELGLLIPVSGQGKGHYRFA